MKERSVYVILFLTSVKETKFTYLLFGHFGYWRVSHGPLYFVYFEMILDIQKRLVAEDDEVRASVFQKYIRVS